MPYKDPNTQREYQRIWMERRRQEWFEQNGPCVDCGSWNNLELDHSDSNTKVTHAIWSYSKEKRDAELSKCVARCHDCHVKKTRTNRERNVGKKNPSSKLTEEQVLEIRRRFKSGEKRIRLAEEFSVDGATIYHIVNNRTWKHI